MCADVDKLLSLCLSALASRGCSWYSAPVSCAWLPSKIIETAPFQSRSRDFLFVWQDIPFMFTVVLIKNKVLLEKSHTYLLLLQVVTYFQEFSVTTAAAAAVDQMVLQREKSSPVLCHTWIHSGAQNTQLLFCCSAFSSTSTNIPCSIGHD